jgi:Putative prokaryotic signal transducing protein
MSIDDEWVVLEYVPGDLQAEILRGLLEAQGIPVFMSQESAGRAIGLTVGPLGEVTLLVRAEDLQEAQRVLEDYRSGRFEEEGNVDQEEEPEGD